MASGHNCEETKLYSEEYDCYYCKSCNIWLEDICNDRDCELCKNRPLTPEMTNTDKIKIEFAPGCFDNFEGTQEELDELMAEIVRMAESGELSEKSVSVDLDEILEEDPEFAEKLINSIESRKLQ